MALFHGILQCVSLFDPRNPVEKDFCAISVLNLKYEVVIFFQTINCMEVKIRYDKGISYGAMCLKLTNHGSLG